MEVAVKVMRPDEVDDGKFRDEAERMKRFNFMHLVRLYGVCFKNSEMHIVTEYLKNGNLKDFLRKTRGRWSPDVLCHISQQVRAYSLNVSAAIVASLVVVVIIIMVVM